MSLEQKLFSDLRLAMKSADQLTVGVLRLLLSAIKNRTIQKRTGGVGDVQLSDEEVSQILSSEAKKRKEAIDLFSKGGRTDLADKEKQELIVIERYLPRQLSESEVDVVVDQILEGASTREFGTIMKSVMRELKGRADGKLVSEVIKRKIGQLVD